MNLGEKLRNLRKNLRGLTLARVAEDTGLAVSFLSDIERGNTKPSLATLQKLASYYQVNLSELLEESNQPTINDGDLLPPGLKELVKEDPNIEKDIIEVMLSMEKRAKKKPITKEDWKNYYHSLKWMMGR
jgi:transcriptional regulator with XRE-family HTH domain